MLGQRARTLGLYRAILRKGENELFLTDLKFFKRKVRSEFVAGRAETTPQNAQLLFEAGRRFLARLGGLM
jgi:pyruvate-formate lyase-activating enzyme